MAAALSKSGVDSPTPWANPIDEGIVTQLWLSHFASLNTKKFFDVMQIETDILEQDHVWLDSNEHYIIRRQRVQQLKVVNDAAERGVYLIQNFNSVMLLWKAKKNKANICFRLLKVTVSGFLCPRSQS